MTRGERTVAIAAPISLILAWQVAVSTKLLNPGLFPPPTDIAASFWAYLTSGELFTNTIWTLTSPRLARCSGQVWASWPGSFPTFLLHRGESE